MWLAQSMKQAVPTADADQGFSTIVGDTHLRSGRLCVAAGERGFRAGH